MWTEIIFWLFGFLIGLACMLIAWIRSDNLKDKEKINRLYNAEDWCYENCKLSEKCFSNHKDSDDALEELINTYCINCPIGLAQEYVEKQEVTNK